jgi:anthranilate synthase component 2
MRVLFIENRDSFSWNVVEALPFARAALRLRPGHEAVRDPAVLQGIDAVVLGPGPTDPVRAGLVDLVRSVARARLPFLGICLGHQALGLAFGARLVRTTPMHGRTSTASFGASRCFPGLAGPVTVMRYHSLALADVGAPLRVVAATDDGLPMAIEHDALPMAGLQFHPDSYATPRGREILATFFGAVS